jgi:hypothetical protein
VQAWITPPDPTQGARPSVCHRIPVTPGCEVILDEQHPLLRLGHDPATLAEAFRRTVAELLAND